MPQVEDHREAVIFPYFRNGELVNRKYRQIERNEKNFRLEARCELVLYGLDDIEPGKPLVWVEGECDKLACEVAGFRNVVSLPNGAPPPGAKNYDSLFGFFDADREKIEAVKKHIIAVDSDAASARLEDELSRRLGVEKCSRLRWPDGVKDANEMLIKHGADDLRWLIEHAEPFPIEGIVEVADRHEDLRRLYAQGFERGYSTGWREVDRFYTVRPGEFTALTGIPSSGKSNWLDALLVNLARLHGWNFAIFSPENLPLDQHMSAIPEKFAGKPYHDGPTPRMTPVERDLALVWLNEHFSWILPSSEDDWARRIACRTAVPCARRLLLRPVRARLLDEAGTDIVRQEAAPARRR